MIHCSEVQNLIMEELDGNLSEKDQVRLLEHCRMCPECEQIREEFFDMDSFLTERFDDLSHRMDHCNLPAQKTIDAALFKAKCLNLLRKLRVFSMTVFVILVMAFTSAQLFSQLESYSQFHIQDVPARVTPLKSISYAQWKTMREGSLLASIESVRYIPDFSQDYVGHQIK